MTKPRRPTRCRDGPSRRASVMARGHHCSRRCQHRYQIHPVSIKAAASLKDVDGHLSPHTSLVLFRLGHLSDASTATGYGVERKRPQREATRLRSSGGDETVEVQISDIGSPRLATVRQCFAFARQLGTAPERGGAVYAPSSFRRSKSGSLAMLAAMRRAGPPLVRRSDLR
jgi:hypothetical protein